MDELKCIELAKNGNLFAFNELVLNYQTTVYNLSMRILADNQAAEDATQETFIAAFRNLHQFKGGSFKSWLLRSASNHCIDAIRKNKRRAEIALEPITQEGDEVDDPRWMRDDSADPAAEFEKNEMTSLIQQCINDLVIDQRIILVLVDVFGLDYKEVQEVILKPLGTVKSRLARAREAIKHCLLGFAELYPELDRHSVEKTI